MIHIEHGQPIQIRKYSEQDFVSVNKLNAEEQWTNLVAGKDKTKQAWNNSNIAFVVLSKEEVIGYIRGFTDKHVTLYICELLIDKRYRGLGIGQYLLKFVHGLYPSTRIEMLASSESQSFYNQIGYRPFYGFRKTFGE
ncbi:GNAT family N-acetyltransferase [Pradoshia sp. D12]|uniref:GNAT family N-acetyltransferase n=1 Tax=Bacillaceae TaxID=186817 RepID=UPI00080AE59B|nr:MULTISPECIES: GNAT family N-acetyltransferase [Bacillaceae]OCA90042.1 GCN5 family acetyltransferase [Bacillus sp. FJAT-27986]QFK70551.1 GNAT family N-acetyltransferase [Pradoshia sp. D12]TPF72347.1 GNAT family N-acetyltransferase [Bacillus sp. D12]